MGGLETAGESFDGAFESFFAGAGVFDGLELFGEGEVEFEVVLGLKLGGVGSDGVEVRMI